MPPLPNTVNEADHPNGASCTGAQQSDCKWKLGQTLREWFSHVFFVLGDSTGWSLVWPSSHDLVIFSCRGLVKLQQPCKQARVRMLSMEPFGRKYKLTTAYSASQPFNQRQSTWDPWTFFVWWLERLSDELMNVVQLLEAFFYSQDLKQLCWWRTSFRKDNASECWPGCSNHRCSYSMHFSDSCLHLKWSSSRKVSYKSKHLWIV